MRGRLSTRQRHVNSRSLGPRLPSITKNYVYDRRHYIALCNFVAVNHLFLGPCSRAPLDIFRLVRRDIWILSRGDHNCLFNKYSHNVRVGASCKYFLFFLLLPNLFQSHIFASLTKKSLLNFFVCIFDAYQKFIWLCCFVGKHFQPNSQNSQSSSYLETKNRTEPIDHKFGQGWYGNILSSVRSLVFLMYATVLRVAIYILIR